MKGIQTPAELAAASNTKSARWAVTAAAAIGTGLRELKARGTTPAALSDARTRMLQAAGDELTLVTRGESKRLDAELAQMADAYERHEKRHADDIERQTLKASRKYGAMTADELARESNAVLQNRKHLHPAELDVLSIELKTTDIQHHAAFRQHIRDNRLAEPWRNTPEGRAMAEEQKATNAAKAQTGTFVADIDGHFSVMALTQILDEVAE